MTLRARLALSYCVIVLVVLLVLSAALFWDEPRVGIALLDADLQRDAVTIETVLRGAGSDSSDSMAAILAALKLPGRGMAIFRSDGTLLRAQWDGLEPRVPVGVRHGEDDGPRTVLTESGLARAYQLRLRAPADHVVVIVRSLDGIRRDATILRRSLLFALPVAVIVASLGGWFVLTRSMRPLELMAREAAGITAAEPGRRLTVAANPTDLRGLATTFNELLERLSTALERQREFMADASHELRTPASVARTAAEVTLSNGHRSEAEYREALTIVREQTVRMAKLIDDMLLLARADMGHVPMHRTAVYLDEIAAESVRSLRVLAQPRDIAIALDCPELHIHGDEALIRQMLVNLIDNAVRHTPSGGTVRVNVSTDAGAAWIDVIDQGPGVPPAERDRIFERFVKLESSHVRHRGAGLGLPIARWIANAHGGSLTLLETSNTGSTFRATLPL